jgi:hypothetical protein
VHLRVPLGSWRDDRGYSSLSLKGDFDLPVLRVIGEAVGPFEEDDVGIQVVLEAGSLGGGDAVEVGVKNRRGGLEGLEEVEGGRADGAHVTEGFEEAADEGGFARAEGAFQADEVAGLEAAGEGGAEGSGGLLGGEVVGFD